MTPEELNHEAQAYARHKDDEADEGYDQWLDEHPDGTPDEYEVRESLTQSDRW